MRTSGHRTVIVSAIVLVLLVGGIAGACEDEPVNVDPEAVLDAASVNMKELTGFHFVYELHQPESADKAEGVQSVEGDIDAEGDMRATVLLLGSGVLFNVDFVALGDTHYLRYPLSPDWQPMPPEDSPLGRLNLATLSIQILDNIAGPSYEGTGKKGGHKTYQIKGTVTGADVEQIAGSAPDDELFATDLWVGIEDGLLYEVDISGPMTTKEADGTWRSIILSDLGAAVDIKAPQ